MNKYDLFSIIKEADIALDTKNVIVMDELLELLEGFGPAPTPALDVRVDSLCKRMWYFLSQDYVRRVRNNFQ